MALLFEASLLLSRVNKFHFVRALMLGEKLTNVARLGALMVLGVAGWQSARAQQAPIISVQPQSQTVLNGADATFNVAVSGHKLAFQWRFNTLAIPGQTNETLIVTSAQCSNAGNYSVIITNSGGSVISTGAVLTVIDTVPPLMTCPAIIQVQTFSEIPPPDPGAVIALDTCSGVALTFAGDSYLTNGTDINVSRLWQAADFSGNTTQCVQSIVVNSNCIPAKVLSFRLQRQREDLGFLATGDIVVSGTSPFFYTVCLGNFCTNFVSFLTTLRVGPLFEPFSDVGPIQGVMVTNQCGHDGAIVAGASALLVSRGLPGVATAPPPGFYGPVLTTACGVLGTNSLWFNVRAVDEGIAVVSTEGSGNDTILAVYDGQISSPSTLHLVACNNDISPLNKQSRVQFQAQTNYPYYLVLGGTTTSAGFRIAYGLEPELQIRELGRAGQFELHSSPAPPLAYDLQASSDLVNWVVLASTNFAPLALGAETNSLTNAVLCFQQTNSQPLSQQYYRMAHAP